MIFVNSMSDLFHKDVDRKHIDRVFDALIDVPVRVLWLGVSVEDAPRANRIGHLKQINTEARTLLPAYFDPALFELRCFTIGVTASRRPCHTE